MSTQPADAANKASSNNFNRQSYSLAGGPAKKTLKQGLPLALAFSFLLGLMAVPQSAHGQTFSVLYSFTNEVDGVSPDSLVLDAAGNLYGTTFYGGFGANGTVYKLDTAGKKTLLYQFKELPDGNGPGGLVRDSAGNLFGVTYYGGFGCSIYRRGCGTVFKLDASGRRLYCTALGVRAMGDSRTA